MKPVSPPDTTAPKRRSRWVWVSLLLGVVSIGLLAWALTVKSDRDSTQDELDTAQQELTSTQKELDETEQDLEQQSTEPADENDGKGGALVAAGGLAAAKSVYDDLTAELGATQEDLTSTEQDLEDANADAKQAEQDAAAAKKKAESADDETDKARAEADEAKADAKATESRATVVAECMKAYVSELGLLFEGDDVSAQATKVRKQLESITGECKTALDGL